MTGGLIVASYTPSFCSYTTFQQPTSTLMMLKCEHHWLKIFSRGGALFVIHKWIDEWRRD